MALQGEHLRHVAGGGVGDCLVCRGMELAATVDVGDEVSARATRRLRAPSTVHPSSWHQRRLRS